MSVDELIGDYEISQMICRTANSCLYKARNRSAAGSKDELPYVLKEMELDGEVSQLEREKEISQDIEKNLGKSVIIPISTVITKGKKEYAVMRMAKNGKFLTEIIKLIEEDTTKQEDWKAEMIFKITDAILVSLGELHKRYLHLDLHPGNIFLENFDFDAMYPGTAKFIDLYSAVQVDRHGQGIKKDGFSFTEGFSAPELFNVEQRRFLSAADTYSVAAITARMFLGKKFSGELEKLDEHLYMKLVYRGENPILDIQLRKFLLCGMEYSEDYRFTNTDRMRETLSLLIDSIHMYKELDYYGLFELAYKMTIQKEKINIDTLSFSGRKFSRSVRLLDDSLWQREPAVNKCFFIFQLMWEMKERFYSQIGYADLISLIKSGIAACNHIGQNKKACELFEELETYRSHMHILDYLKVRLRAAVTLADCHRYEDAYTMMKENVIQLKNIKKCYQESAQMLGMEKSENFRVDDLARSYSALGQYMTYLNSWRSDKKEKFFFDEDPKQAFLEAIREFGDEQTINQNITYAHLMHYALQRKDDEGKRIFKEYERAYFGNDAGIFSQIEEVWAEKEFKFALYVILKAIYIYFMDEVKEDTVEKLCIMLRSSKLRNCKEHPVELIYRYIGLILSEYHKRNGLPVIDMDVQNAFICSITCMESAKIDVDKELTLIMCISYHSAWKFYSLTGQADKQEELRDLLQEQCNRCGWSELLDRLKKVSDWDEIFEYEYS